MGTVESSIWESTTVWAVYGQWVASTTLWNVWTSMESTGIWSRVSNFLLSNVHAPFSREVNIVVFFICGNRPAFGLAEFAASTTSRALAV